MNLIAWLEFELAYYDSAVRGYLSWKDSPWNKKPWLSKKVPGTVVSKEGHADSLLGHERTHYNWKKCNFKQYFLLPTPEAKFTLFIEWLSYIYIYIYVCVCVCVCVHIYIYSQYIFLITWPAQEVAEEKLIISD